MTKFKSQTKLSGILLFVVCCLWGSSQAAILNVPSAETPTIQTCADRASPGDTCMVAAGVYNEYVRVTRGGTSETARIAFEGASSGGEPTSKITGFDIRAPYVTAKNFMVEKFDRHWLAPFRITPAANYVQILNNTIKDGIFLTLDDFTFRDNGANGDTLTTPSGNFIQAGFKPGMTFDINDSYDSLLDGVRKVKLLDKNRGWKTILSVTANTITLIDGQEFVNQGPVYAYVSAAPAAAVWFINESASVPHAASGGLVKGNKIDNFDADIIFWMDGANHIIEGNEIIGTKGGDIFRPFGEGHIIRGNYLHDTVRINGFPEHPDIFQAWQNVRNITIENNFFLNFEPDFAGQIGMLGECANGEEGCAANAHSALFRNNVFANISHIFFGSMANINFVNNTFYRAGSQSEVAPLHFNVINNDGSADNTVIQNNAFVACRNNKRDFIGWYYINEGHTGVVTDYNYVAGPEPIFPPDPGNLFPGPFMEAHGVNGGDPHFPALVPSDPHYPQINPLGPDGIPFTLDDGLKPASDSQLCKKGANAADIGAYSCNPGEVFENTPYVPPTWTPARANSGVKFGLFKNVVKPSLNPNITIMIEGRSSSVTLDLFDRKGRFITNLYSGPFVTSVSWNGKNNQGEILASGVYVLRLQGDANTETKKLVVIK